MKTVWLLISPVSLFMNSAVTKSGAAYVTSRSLHSSTEFFGGSKRWSRKDSDIVPLKSSIGEISSKISSRPDFVLMSVRPSSRADVDARAPVTVPDEPVERVDLQVQQVGDFHGFGDLREGDPACGRDDRVDQVLRGVARGGQLLCPSECSRYERYALARMPTDPSQTEPGRRRWRGQTPMLAATTAQVKVREQAKPNRANPARLGQEHTCQARSDKERRESLPARRARRRGAPDPGRPPPDSRSAPTLGEETLTRCTCGARIRGGSQRFLVSPRVAG